MTGDAQRLAQALDPWLDTLPMHAALATGIRALVLDGRLPVGTVLPAERRLAGALGVSRLTVTTAYDHLRDEGWAASNRRAGTWVRLPAAAPVTPGALPSAGGAEWDLTVAALPAPPALVDAVEAAAKDLRRHMAGHGLHPFGVPELRQAVAAHLGRRGLPTRADEVLVTNGALHAWTLLLATFARPGDRVAVEHPTYPAVLDAMAARRVRPVPVPVTAEGGWQVPAGVEARLAHVTPDGQNPTGLLATEARRRALLEALAGVDHVVCDETFADLVLEGEPPPPLGALADGVITVGSMSKAFWAGLRVGWVRARREVLDRLTATRVTGDLAGPVLDQLVAARLLADADHILEERRATLRTNRDALLDALGWLGFACEPPRAGMALWMTVPSPVGATVLTSAALERGLRLTPGPRFTTDGSADHRIRLPLTVGPDRVRELRDHLGAAQQLGCVRQLERRPPRAVPPFTA